MNEPGGKLLAYRIKLALDYLKTHKISQYEIEQELNYTSLSKAKNYDKYPQGIIEKKTRQELFSLILEKFGLAYDDNDERVYARGNQLSMQDGNNTLYYIMYYYAFARDIVDKAIVKIINQKRVSIDYRLDEHWEGSCQVIENYTFIEVEKTGDTTPVKKLMCLFSGTKKHGRPILLGTYSTVKRDGFPAAGRIVLQRVEDSGSIDKRIRSEIDPRITYYLLNKVMVSETFTPNTLNDLKGEFRLIERYAGEYQLFYPKRSELVKAELRLSNDGRSQLTISGILYTGTFLPLDPHTVKLELDDGADFSHMIKESIVIFISTNNSAYAPFYFGSGVSNALETSPNAFSCLITEKEKNTRKGDLKSILESFYEKEKVSKR